MGRRAVMGVALSALAGLAVVAAAAGPGVATALATPMAPAHLAYATLVTDAAGRPLAWVGPQLRRPLAPTDVPPFLRRAVVATEDRTFDRNPGLDVVGLARAAWHDLRAHRLVEGGSGITQQLARTLYLGQGRTLSRKVEEAVLALRLTRRYTKDEILAAYLSAVYFGHGAYGAAAAAETYFARPLQDLTPGELALLAGLPQAPSRLDPLLHPEAALARRRQVLASMVRAGFLRPAEARRLAAETPRLACPRTGRRGAAVADAALAELRRLRPDLAEAVGRGVPLTVVTTIDRGRQMAVESALRRLGPVDAAGVVLDALTGRIEALVGGVDDGPGRFNRALYARRPLASLAKPIVYAAALESRRFTLASRVDDADTTFPDGRGGYRPRNYGGVHEGPTTLRHALASSNNIAAVRLLNEVGLGRAVRLAERLGLRDFGHDLTAALGTASVSPLEVAAAYAAFADYGLRPAPYLVAEVRDAHGQVVYRREPEFRRALAPAVAYLVADALLSVPKEGTAKGLGLDGLAVKTGTSDGRRDVWMAAFDPQRVAVVWAGREGGFDGPAAKVLGPVVRALRQAGVLSLSPVRWPLPAGVERAAGEWYLRGTVPLRPGVEVRPVAGAVGAGTNIETGLPRSEVRARALLRQWLRRFRPSGPQRDAWAVPRQEDPPVSGNPDSRIPR
jgi:penicillin-binding protein 1A